MRIQTFKTFTFKDKLQEKAFHNLVRFSAIILLFAIVSRGTASAFMPTVTLCNVAQGIITESISVQGVISTAQGLPFTTQDGILIQQVLVQVGEQVAQGQALAIVSSTGTDAKLKAAKAQLAVLQTQYQQQIKAEPTDTYSVSKAQADLDRAYEMYNNATTQDEKNAALLQAQAAEEARNSALHYYNQALEQANKSSSLNKANAKVTLTQIDSLKASINALEQIVKQGYNICADTSGVITELRIIAGNYTAEVGGFIATDMDTSVFTFTLTQEDSQKIAVGNEIIIEQGKTKKSAIISTISPVDSRDKVTVSAVLKSASLKVGNANASINIKSTAYDMCLPSGAVFTDNEGGFVYVLEQNVGVLGVQSVVRRVFVTQHESANGTTAVTGALSSQSMVILTSSRLLQNGARVKVAP